MRIGKTKLEIFAGDITKAGTEALVSPANDMLWTGGEISAAIRREGGKAIESEAMSNAPAEIGSAVVTGAGNLNARWVIHAVISGQDLSTDEDIVRRAVCACCSGADEIGCRSLAFPILDSSSFDVEIHRAARIVVEEAIEYLLGKRSSIERIVFVEHDEAARGLFNAALHDKFTKHG